MSLGTICINGEALKDAVESEKLETGGKKGPTQSTTLGPFTNHAPPPKKAPENTLFYSTHRDVNFRGTQVLYTACHRSEFQSEFI